MEYGILRIGFEPLLGVQSSSSHFQSFFLGCWSNMYLGHSGWCSRLCASLWMALEYVHIVCFLVPFNWLPQVDAILSPATSYLIDILRDRSAEAMAANKSVGSHRSSFVFLTMTFQWPSSVFLVNSCGRHPSPDWQYWCCCNLQYRCFTRLVE